MAQSVERRIGSAEVTGPIPVSSSFRNGGSLVFTGLPFFMIILFVKSTAFLIDYTPLPSSNAINTTVAVSRIKFKNALPSAS